MSICPIGKLFGVVEMEFPIVAICLVTIFLAGLTQGFAGFGYSQIIVPIIAFFYAPQLIIPVALLHSVVLNLLVLWDSHRSVNIGVIVPLLLSAIFGIPIGTYLLLVLNPNIIKMLIGILIIVSSAAMLFGFRKRITKEKLVLLPVGFLSGILNGSTTMSGPPVILLFSNQGFEKDAFRANLCAYFFTLNILTVPAYIVGKLIDHQSLINTLFTLPVMVFGVVLGIMISKKVHNELFQKIALITLMLIGVAALISGAMML